MWLSGVVISEIHTFPNLPKVILASLIKILCIVSYLCDFRLLFLYWLSHSACGILVPKPVMEPRLSPVKAWSQPLDHQETPQLCKFFE